MSQQYWKYVTVKQNNEQKILRTKQPILTLVKTTSPDSNSYIQLNLSFVSL